MILRKWGLYVVGFFIYVIGVRDLQQFKRLVDAVYGLPVQRLPEPEADYSWEHEAFAWAVDDYVDGKQDITWLVNIIDERMVAPYRPKPHVTVKFKPTVTRKFSPKTTGKLKDWPPPDYRYVVSLVEHQVYWETLGVYDWSVRGNGPVDESMLVGQGLEYYRWNLADHLAHVPTTWRWSVFDGWSKVGEPRESLRQWLEKRKLYD